MIARAFLPGLLAQPGSLMPGFGQLGPVLLERLVRLGLASSARFRPPSIASVRSSRVWVILGSSTFHSAKKTMPNPIAPTITSVQFGTSGFGDDVAASRCNMCGYLPAGSVT